MITLSKKVLSVRVMTSAFESSTKVESNIDEIKNIEIISDR